MSALWTAPALARATGGVFAVPFAATGVSIDSRTLSPGDLFIALRAGRDGHDHVADALSRGAAGAMVEHVPEGMHEAPLLRVTNTETALGALGGAGRARFGGTVVAVTGSVGKTTTKDMLRLCLSDDGAAHAAEASHNNHWGVPLTLARMPPATSAAIVEIGMNGAGEIAPLARLAAPDVAVITTIAASHIGPLGSIEAIADEKASVAAGLAEDGVLVLPADTVHLDRLRAAAGGRRVVLFGQSAGAEARLVGLRQDQHGSTLSMELMGRAMTVRLGAPGRHVALNALAALAVTAACRRDTARAAAALEAFRPGPGRGAQRRIDVAGGEALLLDDSYNASSASIRAALEVLSLMPARRRLAVLGEMRELGAHAAAEHAGLAGAVESSVDLLFTCGANMRLLREAVAAPLRAAHEDTAEALGPLVLAALRPGDAVLVKGSNASRMRRVVEALELSSAPG